jgi:hypothetical protein
MLTMLEQQTFRSVVDAGCGEQYLRSLLPANVDYTGLDLYPHCASTILCDFNKGQFPSVRADVIFLAGIIEYICDVDRFIAEVCERAEKWIAVSYNFGGANPMWVNRLTEDELLAKFARHGFLCEKSELGCWEGGKSATVFFFTLKAAD